MPRVFNFCGTLERAKPLELAYTFFKRGINEDAFNTSDITKNVQSILEKHMMSQCCNISMDLMRAIQFTSAYIVLLV